MLIHLDTDLGGDADDLCALAMLLADPEVELTGITTSADVSGERAAFVRHVLELAGRTGIPVAAGAAGFFGGMAHVPGNHDARYFPDFDFEAPIGRDPPGAAFELLARSIGMGAAVAAIGPYTNIAAFEAMRPGELSAVPLTVMGGWLGPFPDGYPHWGPNMDYNVQADRVAASVVFGRLAPLVVPLNVCLDVALRRADLPALEGGGPLARLIARQGLVQCADSGFERLAAAHRALPDDLLNFHWDPLACAAALGWDCLEVSRLRLDLVERDGQLVLTGRPGAPLRSVVTAVDAEAFRARWLELARRV